MRKGCFKMYEPQDLIEYITENKDRLFHNSLFTDSLEVFSDEFIVADADSSIGITTSYNLYVDFSRRLNIAYVSHQRFTLWLIKRFGCIRRYVKHNGKYQRAYSGLNWRHIENKKNNGISGGVEASTQVTPNTSNLSEINAAYYSRRL